MEPSTKISNIIIISTTESEKYKDFEVSDIPFWKIREIIPDYYISLFLNNKILDRVKHPYLDELKTDNPKLEKTKAYFRYISDLKAKDIFINENILFSESSTKLDSFPFRHDELKIRYYRDGESLICVFPAVDYSEERATKPYVDYLMHACIKTLNLELGEDIDEGSLRYTFILHEKDLGLPETVKEKVIQQNDFELYSELAKCCSPEIISKLLDEINIVVFQHGGIDSPNVYGGLLSSIKEIPKKENKTDYVREIINNVSGTISKISYPWKIFVKFRNSILLAKKGDKQDISDVMTYFSELLGEDEGTKIYEIIDNLDNGENDIWKDLFSEKKFNCDIIKSSDDDIKDAFDRVLVIANVNNIYEYDTAGI